MRTMILVLTIFSTVILQGCQESKNENEIKNKKNMSEVQNKNLTTATFASGCFWCTEAIFERVKGVYSIESGYTGGTIENPSYQQVSNGNTNHAEAIQLMFDSTEITYDELLEIFWKTHDPTTLNKQGADTGTQYRSAVFYHNEEQKRKAEFYKNELNKAGLWKDPIVTEIVPFKKFYKAEDYHQDYYENNPNQGYCAYVITPKVEKFEKIFKSKLKKD